MRGARQRIGWRRANCSRIICPQVQADCHGRANPKLALSHQLATNGLLAIFFFLPAHVSETVFKLESPPCADDFSLSNLRIRPPSWKEKRRTTWAASCAPKPASSTN